MIGMATVVNDYPLYYEATNEYGRLSKGALKYFDNSLIEKLKKRLSEAETDFEREEKIKTLQEEQRNILIYLKFTYDLTQPLYTFIYFISRSYWSSSRIYSFTSFPTSTNT